MIHAMLFDKYNRECMLQQQKTPQGRQRRFATIRLEVQRAMDKHFKYAEWSVRLDRIDGTVYLSVSNPDNHAVPPAPPSVVRVTADPAYAALDAYIRPFGGRRWLASITRQKLTTVNAWFCRAVPMPRKVCYMVTMLEGSYAAGVDAAKLRPDITNWPLLLDMASDLECVPSTDQLEPAVRKYLEQQQYTPLPKTEITNAVLRDPTYRNAINRLGNVGRIKLGVDRYLGHYAMLCGVSKTTVTHWLKFREPISCMAAIDLEFTMQLWGSPEVERHTLRPDVPEEKWLSVEAARKVRPMQLHGDLQVPVPAKSNAGRKAAKPA